MNQLTNRPPPGTIIQQSQLLDNLPEDWDDLTAGVAVSFPILGIKGGKFHYRFRGEDQILADNRGFAVPAIQVVVIKAQKELSRTFYADGYVEGANRRPDCMSSDGVRPDDSVAEPVNPVCATCPNAQWGSGATPASPKAQACQQRRRTVVVPYWGDGDLTNEGGGGPVLLSVPPGSLNNQVEYGKWLKENRARYYGCVTQLSFDQDPSVAFPKLEFSYVQALTDDEVAVILGVRETEQVERIINANMDSRELEDTTPTAPVAQAVRTSQAAPVVKPAAQASSVKPPATAQTTGAIPNKPAAAPIATKAAAQPQPAQAQPTQQTAAGRPVQPGAVQAVRPGVQAGTAAAAGRAVKPTGGITEAVNKPAVAPASARTVKPPVQQAAPPTAMEEPPPNNGEGQVDEGTMEAEANVMVPGVDMTGMFKSVMERK